MLPLLLLIGCAPKTALPEGRPAVDVAIVPGCPTLDDGHLSECLWRRTVWAARLYELGVVKRFIPSGNAAYNAYVEAEAIASGLQALGVPADAIYPEVHALHTDENIGFALQIARDHNWRRIGVASDRSQAAGGCAMLKGWGHDDCTVLGIDYEWTYARMAQGLPEVVGPAVPPNQWLPLAEREAVLAQARGTRPRPSSLVLYATGRLSRRMRSPPSPPSERELQLIHERAVSRNAGWQEAR